MPLIWSDVINLSLKLCESDEPFTGAVLYKFAQILLQVAEDKEGSKWGRGLLGAIGIVKQTTISLK